MAKTRLTKTLRAAILDSVLKGTTFYREREKIVAEASALARELVIARLPEGFLEATASLPREWFQHSVSVSIDRDWSPEHAMYTLDDGDKWYYGRNITFEPVRHPANFNIGLSKTDEELFEPLLKRAQRGMARYDKVRSEMGAFLAGMGTVEAVLEQMPALARHIPKASKPFPVAVTTARVTAALEDAGFDIADEDQPA